MYLPYLTEVYLIINSLKYFTKMFTALIFEQKKREMWTDVSFESNE